MLRAVFSTDERFEVVGEAATGTEAVNVVNLTRPDVVVLDLLMPEMDGLEAAEHITSRAPATRIVFLTGIEKSVLPDSDATRRAVYLQKGASVGRILHTVAEAAGRSDHTD